MSEWDIPKPKKRKRDEKQEEMVLDEGKGLSSKKQQYDLTSIINEVRVGTVFYLVFLSFAPFPI